MRSFVDTYLLHIVKESMNCTKTLPDQFFVDASDLSKEIPHVQKKAEDICKLLVDADHVKTILSVDAEADSKSRLERMAYLQSLNPENLCSAVQHKIALECILTSELLLASDNLNLEQIVYHRARTFAYSLIFILKQDLLPIFLLGTAAFTQTCQFALAAVLLDDAEDFDEDSKADSPTLFTRSSKEEALTTSRSMLAYLESLDKAKSQLSFLDTRDFLLMASLKVDEFGSGVKTQGLDTKLLLRRLAREHWSDSWRGI